MLRWERREAARVWGRFTNKPGRVASVHPAGVYVHFDGDASPYDVMLHPALHLVTEDPTQRSSNASHAWVPPTEKAPNPAPPGYRWDGWRYVCGVCRREEGFVHADGCGWATGSAQPVDADDVLEACMRQLDEVCTWLHEIGEEDAAKVLHEERDRWLLPLAKAAVAEDAEPRTGSGSPCIACGAPSPPHAELCVEHLTLSRDEAEALAAERATSAAKVDEDYGLAVRTLEYEAGIREQEVASLRAMLDRVVSHHDNCHSTSCHAFESGVDDGDLADEDVTCDCDMTDLRNEARALLARSEPCAPAATLEETDQWKKTSETTPGLSGTETPIAEGSGETTPVNPATLDRVDEPRPGGGSRYTEAGNASMDPKASPACTCGFAEGDGNAAPVLDVRCPKHGSAPSSGADVKVEQLVRKPGALTSWLKNG